MSTAESRDRSAAQVVEGYFARIRAADRGVADLFHEDAELIGLGGRTKGREAIRAFYGQSFDQARPSPRLVGELMSAGGRVAAEIEIGLADGSVMHVVDLFVVVEGLIRSLTYFVADHD
jgi:hypothetical protein